MTRNPRMLDVGEKAFLRKLLPRLSVHSRFVNGFGHDASIVDLGLSDTNLVMKIDRAAKPIAAINGWCDYRLWGRLAVTANCSDILTAGGSPKAFMMAISAPPATPASLVTDIIKGAEEACQEEDVAFVGGDTKEAGELQVVGTALGVVAKDRHIDRRLGEPGDRIIVAGCLGGYVGAYWHCANSQTTPSALSYLSRPRARWREAELVSSAACARSACDMSDGLVDAVMSVVRPGLGVMMQEAALPFHPLARDASERSKTDLLNYAFGVGDWCIAYAVPPECLAVLDSLRQNGIELSVVGEVVEKSGVFIRTADACLEVRSASANEHFRSRMEDQGDWFRDLMSGDSLRPIKY